MSERGGRGVYHWAYLSGWKCDVAVYLPPFRKENSIFSLRRWIVSRLCSIIDNNQVKKEEDLIMGVAR